MTLLTIRVQRLDDFFYGTPFCNFECCHFVGREPVRVVQCQSSCGPPAELAVREHLREAEREGLIPCDLTTARDLTRAPQPQYDIPHMAGEEIVHESMHSGRSCH